MAGSSRDWALPLPSTRHAEPLSPLSALGPTQSAGEAPASFDPAIIASRLRRMGDQCNLDFERASSEALAEVLKGKVKAAHPVWPDQLLAFCHRALGTGGAQGAAWLMLKGRGVGGEGRGTTPRRPPSFLCHRQPVRHRDSSWKRCCWSCCFSSPLPKKNVTGRRSKCRNLTGCWILSQDFIITLSF